MGLGFCPYWLSIPGFPSSHPPLALGQQPPLAFQLEVGQRQLLAFQLDSRLYTPRPFLAAAFVLACFLLGDTGSDLTCELSAAGLLRQPLGAMSGFKQVRHKGKTYFWFVWCLRHLNRNQHACQPFVFVIHYSPWCPFFVEENFLT